MRSQHNAVDHYTSSCVVCSHHYLFQRAASLQATTTKFCGLSGFAAPRFAPLVHPPHVPVPPNPLHSNSLSGVNAVATVVNRAVSVFDGSKTAPTRSGASLAPAGDRRHQAQKKLPLPTTKNATARMRRARAVKSQRRSQAPNVAANQRSRPSASRSQRLQRRRSRSRRRSRRRAMGPLHHPTPRCLRPLVRRP